MHACVQASACGACVRAHARGFLTQWVHTHTYTHNSIDASARPHRSGVTTCRLCQSCLHKFGMHPAPLGTSFSVFAGVGVCVHAQVKCVRDVLLVPERVCVSIGSEYVACRCASAHARHAMFKQLGPAGAQPSHCQRPQS